MKWRLRLSLSFCIGLLTVVLGAGTTVAAGPPTICTADLIIFTTDPGAATTTGQVTHFRESGVAGWYTSGILNGYTFSGAQDIMVNNKTHTSQLQGSYIATGPDNNSLTIRYTGHADLLTGIATGHFVTAGGTGAFANFHWEGEIAAHLISLTPPTFETTDTGPCHAAP
ncbi:MAG: hypothetical protein M5U01_03705 [Ardenticatenaceae bacterium]|nr:hypothetical protein [Ardenticatenaceae bacterium]HBY92766.1 hypothetical protein [Chloroflexota bacterium]